MSEDIFEKEKIKLTPESGFNLIGTDYFAEPGNQLYLVEHFEMYEDALNEIQALMDASSSTYELPPLDMIG